MEKVARQLDGPGVKPGGDDVCCVFLSPDEGHAAYEALDPVLSSLKKQREDMRFRAACAVKEHGADDPMSVVACDMVDSAQSAYDTRLLELKKRPDLYEKIQQMVKAAARAEAEAARDQLSANYREKMERFYGLWRDKQKIKKAQSEAEEGLFTAFILTMMLQWTIRETHRRLQLASVFMRASRDMSSDREMPAT